MPSLRCQPFPTVAYAGAYAALRDDFGRVAPFFAYDPADPAAWCARAEELDRSWSGSDGHHRREQISQALDRYVLSIGGSQPQRNAAARLGDPRALVVVTGQQAGLLTGPLLTILKAITALRLAAQMEAALDRPVVPVFWIASEDHDFAEINQVRAVDGVQRPVRLRLPPMPNRRSIGEIPVPAAARHLVRAAEALNGAGSSPDPEAVRWMEDTLASALRGHESLARWFARMMAILFADRRLVLLDPMLPELRELAVPVIRQAWRRAPAVNAELAAAAQRLRADGFTPGLNLEPDHLHVFHADDTERVALFHSGRDGVVSRHREISLSPSAFEREVEGAPARFSPGVVLRPVVQEVLLPTLAQVSGPGEAAYLSQMRKVYPLFGRTMPVIVPRVGATLALPEDEEAAAAVSLSLGDLRDGRWRDALAREIRSRSDIDVTHRFAAEREAVRARYTALADDLSGRVAPALREIAERNATHVMYQLSYLERKAVQHERRRERALLHAVEGAAQRLFPDGRLQEATSSIVPYLLRYGLGLARELADTLPLDQGHMLIRLGADSSRCA